MTARFCSGIARPLPAVILSSLLALSIASLAGNMAAGQTTFDFGDAPDGGTTGYVAPFAQTGSFPSLLASDGARVQSTADATLGPAASMEADALVVNADSDDGVSELLILTVSIPPPAKLSVTVNGQPGSSGGTFYVNVLIDLNLDGKWAGATVNGQPEWVVQNSATTVTPGDSNVVPLPEFAFSNGNALPAGAWMRIALTKEQVTAANWDGSGEFSSGEIEDHVISLPAVGGKTPAMPVIENCQPNPALFPPGGVMTMFTCDIYSPQPGFATVAFNCTPDTVTILDFGNIGPPYPVGPATVTLNYIAFKGASPPPRVNCNVVASSQDPPSIVTPTGVMVGFADSVTTVEFDAAEEQAADLIYAAIMSKARLTLDTFDTGTYDQPIELGYAPVDFHFDIAHGQTTSLDMVFIRQVLDLDGKTIDMLFQNITVQPSDRSSLTAEWTPSEPGEYFINTFLWDSLDHPTAAYSPAVSSEITLSLMRSAKWWADRPSLAAQVWENVVAKGQHLQCGDFVIDSARKLMGGLLADPAETTEGTSRGTMEVRIEVTKESLADALNHEAFGSMRIQPGCGADVYGLTFSGSTSVENSFVVQGINSVLRQNTDSQILDRMTDEFLETYFSGQEYSTEPDPELAQELADLSYWDLFAEEPEDEQPEEEEDPLTPPEPDTSEIAFAHRVGDTDCPQYIGSVFLEDAGVEGEWVILDQPEWLNIELDDNFAEFYFNCFIEDVSSHTIESEVEFEFVFDQPTEEEVDDIEITVTGEIIGVEDQ